MIERDPGLDLLNRFVRGRLSRRDAIKQGAALGLSLPALGALAAARPHSAFAQDAPASEITWGLETTVPNVIPFGGIALAQWQGKEFMYDSLLEWDKDLNVLPALAESYETPDDLTYIFHLRKGVKFHDGAEMLAKDVKYSLDTALAPPEPGVAVPYLANVVSSEVVDDYTVKVTMAKLDPTLVGTLAWTHYTPIVPEGMLDNLNPLSEGIGAGPFKLVEFIPEDQIVYEAFPDYWREDMPKISRLTLKMMPDEPTRIAALRSGEIIGTTLTPDAALTLEGDSELTVLTGLTSSPQVIQFSMVKDVPWRDVNVRKAINLAVDRQEIIDKVFAGNAVLTGVIPPGYGDWPQPEADLVAAYTQDVDAAIALMETAGLADGFDVTLQSIASPRHHTQIAEIIQEQLKAININVSVEPLEIGTFAANIGSGEFEWASTARGMRGDPSAHVVDFRTGGTNNLAWFGDGWKSDELNQLYDEALASLDSADRHAKYLRIQQIITEEVPNLYTVQSMKYQVVNNALQGMYVFYGNTNYGLRQVTVTEDKATRRPVLYRHPELAKDLGRRAAFAADPEVAGWNEHEGGKPPRSFAGSG